MSSLIKARRRLIFLKYKISNVDLINENDNPEAKSIAVVPPKIASNLSGREKL